MHAPCPANRPGRRHHLRGEVGLWEIFYLFAERYALQTTHSQLGIGARLYVPPQPLVRLPALELTSGVSCRLIEAGARDERPCDQLDELSAWLSVLVRPGRTPYFPGQ